MQIKINSQIVKLVISRRYRHAPSQPSIQSFCSDGEPYATLTICLPQTVLGNNETILDTNNIPNLLTLLVEKGCVEDTGKTVPSGFCEYPIVKVIAPILD